MKKEGIEKRYLSEFVYGGIDGSITTFAIVAGSLGASLSSAIILILGFANLFADGFSMAASNFLGTRSEDQLFRKEEEREIYEVENLPDREKTEIREVFENFEFTKEDTEELVNLVSKNKHFWVDFMMRYELRMSIPDEGNEWKASALTFISFVIAGSLPLMPFIIFEVNGSTFIYSIIATGLALFIVGAARYFVTMKNWLVSGLEMLIVGGIAAGVSYCVGYLISLFIQ